MIVKCSVVFKLLLLVYDLSTGHSCKEGFLPINKQKRCKNAAQFIGLTFSGIYDGKSRPHGCFQQGNSGKILFNQGWGGGNYAENDKVICRKGK